MPMEMKRKCRSNDLCCLGSRLTHHCLSEELKKTKVGQSVEKAVSVWSRSGGKGYAQDPGELSQERTSFLPMLLQAHY